MQHPQTPSCTLLCRADRTSDLAAAPLSRLQVPLLREGAASKPQLWNRPAACMHQLQVQGLCCRYTCDMQVPPAGASGHGDA